MKILNSILLKLSSPKKVFLLFAASQLVFLAMMLFTFPVINNQIGTRAFDLQTFGYSFSTAETIVNNLNEQTINLYLFPQLTLLDLFYPVLLALFLGGLLFRLMNKTKTKGQIISALPIIPLLGMVADYSENICIILMITKSIELTEAIVFLSSTLTVLKGVLTSIAWIAIVILSIKWAISKIRAWNDNQAIRAKTY